MSSKVLLLSALCLLGSCWGAESSVHSARDTSKEPLNASPPDDLKRESSRWQAWNPWNIFKPGNHHTMFNNPLTHSSKFWESDNGRHHMHHDRVGRDSQRTLTRRESSLIADKTISEGYDTERTQSTRFFQSESFASLPSWTPRPHGSVRRELITLMFESMLDCMIESWDVIVPPVKPEDIINPDVPKTPSEQTFTSKKTKKGGKESAPPPSGKTSRTKRNRSSKMDVLETQEPLYQPWWSAPDERAIIRFKNGNIYEGDISMKRMHGEGRFQWSDGTVYLGRFKDNEMCGRGFIQWKDDTWYEGDFTGNVRHGQGLYVDSRKQGSYVGSWHLGTKHGKGIIHYPSLKTNSYDGDWEYNVRHGYGSREYSYHSGYKGEWDRCGREGKGLMIWPNHDFYKGGWQNGVMSGYGLYIWNAYYNNTMTLPSISVYSGLWHKGQRNGYGILNFGLGLGSHYKGNFKNNKKHGPGKLVTNNGLIMQNDKALFIDDVLGPVKSNPDEETASLSDLAQRGHAEPFQFDICDATVGLTYHIDQALKNLDKEPEIRTNMVNDYLEINKPFEPKLSEIVYKELDVPELNRDAVLLDDIIQFEEISLQKSVRCYETELTNIYYQYATVCNTEEIHFGPVMIRLYLWQFYYDCNIHELGLSLVETDRMFHECPDLLSRNSHDPFEKIYLWQFIHSLITVANRLYSKRELPGVKPDTILGEAFRTFMEKDVLPNFGQRKGFLVNGYGLFVPLKGAYALYRTLGDPHTVRQFLCATRRPPHYQYISQPDLVDSPDDATPVGRNAYVFGTDMTFSTEEPMPPRNEEENEELQQTLKLFNFGNLSSKSIIKIFSNIFPRLIVKDKIMNLDIEMTFYEFFEAFVACTQKSIRVKEEENQWKETLTSDWALINAPNATPGVAAKSHKHA